MMSESRGADPARRAAESLAAAGIDVAVESPTNGDDPRELVDRAVQIIAQSVPPGWRSVHGVFSMAGGQEIAKAVAVTSDGAVGVVVAVAAAELIRRHRQLTAGPQGPWLRLLFDLDATGAVKVGFDYGEAEPIPADQLLPSEAYLRDFEEFPRADAPVWLLAYMGNEGQQLRSPAQARAGVTTAVDARRADDEVPALDLAWARMALVAAMGRGAGAPVGLRVDPAFEVYQGINGGCTLARLPGDRAVLSGGRADSRLLSAAYKGEMPWPDLYRGAPPWLDSLYLDPRAANGLLSFCYWWDGRGWWRADLPGIDSWSPIAELQAGVPGIWTSESTATLLTGLMTEIGVELVDRNAYAATDLVRAAEVRIVSGRYVNRLFVDGVPGGFDVSEVIACLDAADVLLPVHPPIDQGTAKNVVVDFCRANDVDTSRYPLDGLVASRLDAGWQVFAPIDPGEVAVGRTMFLVADDGVVDQVSTSTPPDELAFVFASRFASRVRRVRGA